MSTTDTQPRRLVVLLSGRGSHFENLYRRVHLNPTLNAQIFGVISDRADAPGLAKAHSLEVPTATVERSEHASRSQFETALVDSIDRFAPDWVILAGFMRILSASALAPYQGRMLNIHPSLLPRHKGLDTHQKVIEAGESEHGASVHFVTAELDGGPILSQAKMAVTDHDTPDSLAERLLPLEHRLMQASVALLVNHDVEVHHEKLTIDGHSLAEPLVLDRDFGINGGWRQPR